MIESCCLLCKRPMIKDEDRERVDVPAAHICPHRAYCAVQASRMGLGAPGELIEILFDPEEDNDN